MQTGIIKEKCRERNISIKRLEKTLGIANGTIGKWERLTVTPKLSTIQKVADYFDCTIDDLLQEDKHS